MRMFRIFFIVMLTCGFGTAAHADVWKWIDAEGKVHFVDSDKAIYTWVDENGKHFYADTPGHEDAVSVELVWHAKGKLAEFQNGSMTVEEGGNKEEYPDETPEERFEREQAEAYYCKRAQQIYESYMNAPRLYKTADDGTRKYLSDEEMESTIAETKARVDELCS